MNTSIDNDISLLVKFALEYNANVVAYFSLIHSQGLKEKHYKRAIADFKKMQKEYIAKTADIIKELETRVS